MDRPPGTTEMAATMGTDDVRSAARAIRLRADAIIGRLLEGDLDEEVARVCDELMMTQLKALGLERSQGREEEQKKGGSIKRGH